MQQLEIESLAYECIVNKPIQMEKEWVEKCVNVRFHMYDIRKINYNSFVIMHSIIQK